MLVSNSPLECTCFTYTPTLIIHYYGKWTLRWIIILHKLNFSDCWVELKFTSFPCFQLSLHLRSFQTFFTNPSDAILFSWLPEWRGWRWQLSSVNQSQAQFFLRTRAEHISASLSGLWWETSNRHKWGKGKKHITDNTPVSFTLWSGANSGFASVKRYSTMCGKSHTQAQTCIIESMHRITPSLLT